jgi:hypothetical protein
VFDEFNKRFDLITKMQAISHPLRRRRIGSNRVIGHRHKELKCDGFGAARMGGRFETVVPVVVFVHKLEIVSL